MHEVARRVGGRTLSPRISQELPQSAGTVFSMLQCKSHQLRKQVPRHAFAPGGSKSSKLLSGKVAREGIEPPTRGFAVRLTW